jgi:hypothetical protein
MDIDEFKQLRNKMMGLEPENLKAQIQPVIPKIRDLLALNYTTNPAKWMHERLGNYIKDFEAQLDFEHEIGARLVSFGQAITFHIQNVGYWGPDIISFDGVNSEGERVQLIQHTSQLSVLLIAMKKLDENPRRIGFIWDNEKKSQE